MYTNAMQAHNAPELFAELAYSTKVVPARHGRGGQRLALTAMTVAGGQVIGREQHDLLVLGDLVRGEDVMTSTTDRSIVVAQQVYGPTDVAVTHVKLEKGLRELGYEVVGSCVRYIDLTDELVTKHRIGAELAHLCDNHVGFSVDNDAPDLRYKWMGNVGYVLQVGRNLERLFRDGRLEPNYQLKASLDAEGCVDRYTGVEVLARLRGDDGRLISPGIFVPIAEGTGLISDVTDVMTEQALDLVATLRDDYGLDLSAALNISPREAQRLPGYVDNLVEVMRAKSIRSDLICLELTESPGRETEMDVAYAALRKALDNGLSVAVDDLLTGNSALARILKLGDRVNSYKLDRAHILAAMDRHPAAVAWALGTSGASHALERMTERPFHVVVEGAPSGSEALLLEIGATHVQSFDLTGFPMPRDDLIAKVQKDTERKLFRYAA